MTNRFPLATFALCAFILCCSTWVNYEVNGSLLSKIRILDLQVYGGVTFQQLSQGEFWRFFTAQFVHVRPIHMLSNVLSLALLGYFVEKHLGRIKLLLLFFVAGGLGTLLSIIPVPAPFDIGTGASQAVFALSAAAIILIVQKREPSVWLKAVLIMALLPALSLDLIYAGYPKLGHIASFVLGLVLTLGFEYLTRSAKVARAA